MTLSTLGEFGLTAKCKIGIAGHILLKEGVLTAQERQVIMGHPEIGYSILHDGTMDELTEMAAHIAYWHHEKWDGTGYPRGLSGEQIPLEARIVALCDVRSCIGAAILKRSHQLAGCPIDRAINTDASPMR